MLTAPSQSIEAVAQSQSIGFARFKQLIRLSYLAPEIVNAIFAGTQPPQLTLATLKTAKTIPLCWAKQKPLFGLA
jgi:site-specific DNA recombinase